MFATDYFGADYYAPDYYPPGLVLLVAAAILGAAAGCGEGATDEEILAAQVAWDDREVFELLQIILQSGILK